MNDLIVNSSFDFDSNTVRVVFDGDSNPWFVAKDIAEALGYNDTVKAIADHCKHASSLIGLGLVNHPSRKNQKIDPQDKLIPESDVFVLVMKSNLPSAHKVRSSMIEQILDIRHALNTIKAFEMPDDLPDMCVYAIRECDTGNIKMGISRDPEQRLKQMQADNNVSLYLVGYCVTKNRFKDSANSSLTS